MREDTYGIMDIVHLTNSIRIKRCLDAGISADNPSVLLNCLSSGLDVGLTLMEDSVGAFDGLTVEQASKVVNYFRKEAKRYSTEQEIEIWYLSWADAIEKIYLKHNC